MTRNAGIKPPVTYQGAKTRIAARILDIIDPASDLDFYDVCCGSGAISLALVARGFPADRVIMIDRGPWGDVWQAIGAGAFPLKLLTEYATVFEEVSPIYWHELLREMAAEPPGSDRIACFLLLQAGAFGSKAVNDEGGRWKTPGFSRPSPRRGTGMKPRPREIVERCGYAIERMRGVRGVRARASADMIGDGVVYIDPPYAGTTGYGATFDYLAFAREVGGAWVSDATPHGELVYAIDGVRPATGIGGNPRNGEWLSWVE